MSGTGFQFLVDSRQVVDFFDRIADYAPQATAVFLNRTAEWGTRIGREQAVKHFTIRSQQALLFAFPRVIPGKERASPKKLAVTIEPSRIGTVFAPFEEGEPHGPDRLGRWPAIPSTGPLGVRPYPKFLIPKALFPVNLGLAPRRDASGTIYYAVGKGSRRKQKTPFRLTASGKTQMQGKRGTFQIPGAKGPIILQRLGPGTTRPLWYLRPVVRRPRQLAFVASIQRAITDHLEPEMSAAFDYYARLADERTRSAGVGAARSAGYGGA